MGDLISQMESEFIVGLIAILCVFLFLMTCVIVANWRGYRRDEFETSLKQDMLERGMSADEIEKVLKANSDADE